MSPDTRLDIAVLGILAFMLTYLLHSSLLLGGIWVVTKLKLVRRAGTEDALWKLGLAGGLVTATLVTATGFTPLTGRLNLSDGVFCLPAGGGFDVAFAAETTSPSTRPNARRGELVLARPNAARLVSHAALSMRQQQRQAPALRTSTQSLRPRPVAVDCRPSSVIAARCWSRDHSSVSTVCASRPASIIRCA
jgi:hypothetical protein